MAGLVSFVVPAHNEAGALPTLCEEIRAAARALAGPYEIVIVDDGSTDGTAAWLQERSRADEDLVAVSFETNRGQSAALAAGLDASRGERIVTLDADLQNDPADIPHLLEVLDDGFDIVSGWRRSRKDGFLLRTLPSRSPTG